MTKTKAKTSSSAKKSLKKLSVIKHSTLPGLTEKNDRPESGIFQL
jgi:hypothetical protein